MEKTITVLPPIFIFESEIEIIRDVAFGSPLCETGGDLFGYWTHSGFPVILYAIGPGRNARHHPSSFFQDAAYLRQVGVELNDRYALQHIGEWHSHHHLPLSHPSHGDVKTVRRAQERYGCPRFTLLICNLIEESTPVLDRFGRSPSRYRRGRAQTGKVLHHAYLFQDPSSGPQEGYLTCHWVQLPGRSPIREHFGRGSLNARDMSRAGTHPPDSELCPFQRTMADLRESSSGSVEALKELSGQERWYQHGDGKRRLGAEMEAFSERCIEAHFFLTENDDVEVVVECQYGSFHYLLPPTYPLDPPEISLPSYLLTAPDAACAVSAWEGGRLLLVDLHEHIIKAIRSAGPGVDPLPPVSDHLRPLGAPPEDIRPDEGFETPP